MIELDEPVKDYVGFLKDEHARNVSEYFEDLVKASGVDEPANIQTVSELRELEAGIHKGSSTRGWWRFARIASLVAAGGAVVAAIQLKDWYYALFAPALALVLFVFLKINKAVKALNERLGELEKQKEAKSAEAWAQMEPLNVLYRWETARKLFQKTFPDIKLDPYFSNQRLTDLASNYGLSNSFNDGRSMLINQSGTLKENPFAISRYIHHWIGSKTYYGSITIFWTEQVRNAQGNWVTVQRSQVLTASVTKPFPEYVNRTTLIYGHEAAPNLTFSRTPSNLSGLGDGVMDHWRKEHAVKKVEKKARKDVKTGNGNLTVMSNREFEALFNATNRDNEIEFRLLFTPLAQQEMVNLMNDKEAGYGDDFSFVKQGQINYVEPVHLAQTRFDGDPRMFQSLELAQARKFFNDFHNDYFRSLYFGMAPLLTVPMYRDNRTVAKPKVSAGAKASSFWEHEAMANYLGHEQFAHPDSITQNILKTSVLGGNDASTSVKVVAHGYQGIDRVDIVPMLGMDRRWHEVPVHWVEYIPVSQESQMLVGVVRDLENDDDEAGNAKLQNGWESALKTNGVDPVNAFIRGSLAATILGR
ncbi:MAG: hypothetical protein RLZZ06_1012 [Actinomycetota bacterium]|jgi:hypothetical protein